MIIRDGTAKKSANKKFIVFDNLEAVNDDPDVLRALTGYILRLDNPKFAASGVRFLFVGVVADMKSLLSGSSHAETISNRLYELPEVAELSNFEAEKILRTGFLDKLDIDFGEEEDVIISSCVYYSGRNAQHVHEIGLNVAYEAEQGDWKIGWPQVSSAIIEWAESSLAGHAALVRNRLNRFDTRVQRRNQVLYCIAKITADEFSAGDIDRIVRDEFSRTASADRLGVDQILKGLAQGDNPILSKDPSSNRFRFKHPKFRIAIRYLLKKTEDGDIAENKSLEKPYFY